MNASDLRMAMRRVTRLIDANERGGRLSRFDQIAPRVHLAEALKAAERAALKVGDAGDEMAEACLRALMALELSERAKEKNHAR